jgi:uncharacterized protein (DUF305 family)
VNPESFLPASLLTVLVWEYFVSIAVVMRKISRIAFLAVVGVFGAGAAFGQAVIVRPGAPGEPTKQLPADTRSNLPANSKKDFEFMQGMIIHHAQAVEMTALIAERTTNKEVRLLGAKISQSQADEMHFMKRWLTVRGESTEMEMGGGDSHNAHSAHSGHGAPKAATHQMPGMLTPEQMSALKDAKSAEFDRLFLAGMIQHHEGALVMVKDLFDSPGTGQDAELFNFASDVDSGQRAEIYIMRTLLGEKP